MRLIKATVLKVLTPRLNTSDVTLLYFIDAQSEEVKLQTCVQTIEV